MIKQLPSPLELQQAFPAPSIDAFRSAAKQIVARTDARIALILGPCSVHDIDSTLEYAARLKALTEKISPRFFPIMRVFIEKPRTEHGWKGMLHDPYLNHSSDMIEGLYRSRKLMTEIARLGVPMASELLDPIAVPYFQDLLTWGLIGARTCASQPHRLLTSGLPFPVGFKNDCEGRLEPAITALSVASRPSTHFTIDKTGHAATAKTKGNTDVHLVLRGSYKEPNYQNLQSALHALESRHLPMRIAVDCSHGNSGKNPHLQGEIFHSLLESNYPSLAAIMLESHLYAGKQDLPPKHYGVSVTDGCIGWEETEELLSFTTVSHG